MTQRTEAVICLDVLSHNIKLIRNSLRDGCEIMAVLKGDAYGHGITGSYPTLKACGIHNYAVAIWEEGARLRQAGCEDPILVLGDTCDAQLHQIVANRLMPTISSVEVAGKLNDLAEKEGIIQPVHIKVDTGMSRLGFPADDSCVDAICTISKMKNIKIAGAFSHFSRADEEDGICVSQQIQKFRYVMESAEAAGVQIPVKHLANSPAIMLHPDAQLDIVRAGDILFALCPVEEDIWKKSDFRQVLHWYTLVAHVKEVPAGTAVGYGGTFVTDRPTKIATIPVGFADGYSRRLSNKGKVKIHGMDAPVIGRVCMDQFMVDVTDIPDVRRGDTVTLLDDELSILWMADLIGANVDEIVCGISSRVPRVYE